MTVLGLLMIQVDYVCASKIVGRTLRGNCYLICSKQQIVRRSYTRSTTVVDQVVAVEVVIAVVETFYVFLIKHLVRVRLGSESSDMIISFSSC